ncbi:BatD family protein [Pseudomonas sp. N040]|uniref:BatD family protein n=1 Tax=Pseudomonas sp. N040 TaxID=2785325 RepID=UPI0018A312D4|nr:BatD family protein [Pseudomonas sp. N040]MBF7731276.1 BatD family protein [Pseudomonas sp. N040]MBW7014919.1 BatD family protein [Pseudomonas sp. N040]
MMRSPRALLASSLLLLLLTAQAGAASFTASVERSHLSQGETVELRLQSDDPTLFGKPDLAPLEQDFEVLGSRQLNQLSSINGSTSATTTWTVSLRPRRSGELEIPPLQLGELRSQPIRLQVSQDDGSASASSAPIFIDASLDHDSVYVQAQAVLTLRIYHSVSLYNDSSLTPLKMPDARVEQLGAARTYEKDINGVRHGVIELNYAIFPQKSGELSIPALTFSATLANRSNSSGFMSFGKPTQLKSPSIPLQVKAKPAGYPADAAWLPARALSLNEAWNPEPDNLQVGESVTRSLLLKVDGLSAAQLPPLPENLPGGLRHYPEQPKLASQTSANGVIGSREERQALVPTQSGELLLPAIEVVWWNTEEDRLIRTALPARTLRIGDNPSLLLGQAPSGDPATLVAGNQPLLWPWQLASGLLLCTTLLGFGLWWRARRQPAIVATVQTGPSPRTLLDELKRACQANDAALTRQALDAWARQQPETLADMAARFAPLSEALDGLNGVLYSPSEVSWDGKDLWQAIRNMPPATATTTQAETSPLPPLYPR